MKKANLQIRIFKDGTFNTEWRERETTTMYTWNAKQNRVDTTKSTKTVNTETLTTGKHNLISLESATPLFYAVVDEISQIIAYTALRTILTRSYSEKIAKLMNELANQSKKTDAIRTEYENSIVKYADMLLIRIDDNMTVTAKANAIAENEFRKHCISHHISYTKKEHKYIMRDVNGKKARFECIPYTTLEKTAYGKEVDANLQISDSLDCEDVISTAKLAMYELFSYGLIDSVSDIWNYSRYAYKAVNNYIMKERRYNGTAKSASLYTTNDNGDDEIISVATFEKMFDVIENCDLHDDIKRILKRDISKKSRIENVLKTYELYFEKHYTVEHIGRELNRSHVMIVKYLKNIKNTLHTSEVYEILHNAIASAH